VYPTVVGLSSSGVVDSGQDAEVRGSGQGARPSRPTGTTSRGPDDATETFLPVLHRRRPAAVVKQVSGSHTSSMSTSDDELPLSEIRDIRDDAGWAVRLVDDLVEAAWGCDHAYERIMASRQRFRADRLFENAVTRNTPG
jgi:hypothetical protein